MKYWDTCEDRPELGDNVIMIKKEIDSYNSPCGYRKIGSKVEIIESHLAESEFVFEIEDMIYGLRNTIRNFVEGHCYPNVEPRITCYEDAALLKEAICWLEKN